MGIAGDEGSGHARQRGDRGSEKNRQGYDPGPLHDQDALEASDQGWEKGDLWQDGDGQGETRQDHREGLRGGGAQKISLSLVTRFCLGHDVRESSVRVSREAFEVLPCWFARGGVHVARLYMAAA